MNRRVEDRVSLMRLTYVIMGIAAIVSVTLLLRDDTAPELRGAIWTVWGGGVLITVVTFWYGSSAGTGRRMSDMRPDAQPEQPTDDGHLPRREETGT
jgi:predicted membrane channel-forming protein YqfA (hemolysin III family)